MKKIIFMLASIALFTVFFVSCGSTPEPAKPAVNSNSTQPPVEENNAEENKKNEDSVSQNQNEDAASEVDVAAENQASLEKAESARQSAIDAGADKSLPEKFAEIDALYEVAKEKSNAGEDASSDLDKISKLYSALEQYALALKAKNRIDENNFADYNKTSYDKGCDFLSTADELLQETLENVNADGLLESATNANGQFKNVIFEAYKKLSKDERTKAFIEKRNADAVRAGVAAKDDYNAAVDEFRKGDAAYSMQNPESAYGHYVAAKEQFSAVYTTVSEKRANTEKAMLDAQKQVDDAYSYAQNADKNSPLEGDDIEGIETPDAVLLESDAYEKPEALEADIPEDIDALSEVTEEAEQNDTETQNDTAQEKATDDVFEAEESIIEESAQSEESEETIEGISESEETTTDNAQSEEPTETIEEAEDSENTNQTDKVEEAEDIESQKTETEKPVETEVIEETEEIEEGEATSSTVEESETSKEVTETTETEEIESQNAETVAPVETAEAESSESQEIETEETVETEDDKETSEISPTETDENAEAPAIEETEEVEQNSAEPQEDTAQEIEANEDVSESEETTIESVPSEESAKTTEEVEEIIEIEAPVMEEE